MSWQDDLSVRLGQATEGLKTDINAYLTARIVDPVIKIGQPQQGNLTQLQIEQGQKGSNPDASVGPDKISNGVDQSKMYIGALVVAAIAAWYFIGKKRG
jgi:hypothetical protein